MIGKKNKKIYGQNETDTYICWNQDSIDYYCIKRENKHAFEL